MRAAAKKAIGWLLSPWAALLGMAGGVLMGMYYRESAPALAPYGQAYISFLSMCVYPVLVCAIATSIASLVRGGKGGRRVELMALALIGFVLLAALAGLAGGLLLRPGDSIPEETRRMMAGAVDSSKYKVGIEMNFYSEAAAKAEGFTLSSFVASAVPSNIFAALAESRSLQVLFFAIVLGLALGTLKPESAAAGLAALESFYHAFMKLIKWAMYPLPFGLFCLISEQTAKIGGDILKTMGAFLISFHAAGLLLLAICALVIWRRSGKGLWGSLMAMREPVLLALGTRSSMATLPASIETLRQGIGFKEDGPRLLLPLAFTIGRFGNVLYFSLATVFAAQLYGVEITFNGALLILLCASLAGMATAGSTGTLTLAMLALALEPLRLPWEALLALLIAIDPIADPMRTLLIVYPGCAFSSLLSERESGEAGNPEAAASVEPLCAAGTTSIAIGR